MGKPIRISGSWTASELRRLAASSKHAKESRRLLSLAAVLDGMNRTEAARIGGMDRQTLRDWVHRFNERGLESLKDDLAREKPRRLNEAQQAELAQLVEASPDRAVHGVVRWRRVDLQKLIAERFGVIYHERTIGKVLKDLGFSHISARRRHPGQKPEVMAVYKKDSAETLKAHLAGLPRHRPIAIWFQDEARIGQKNGLVRQWARRGTRPRQPADQRYESAYLFGAICPARGVGVGLAMPYVETEAMQAHLNVISKAVAPGAHAVLLLDRAGWHTTSAAGSPPQHHHDPASITGPGTEPGRERLAVPARQLALKPGVRDLRRDH